MNMDRTRSAKLWFRSGFSTAWILFELPHTIEHASQFDHVAQGWVGLTPQIGCDSSFRPAASVGDHLQGDSEILDAVPDLGQELADGRVDCVFAREGQGGSLLFEVLALGNRFGTSGGMQQHSVEFDR